MEVSGESGQSFYMKTDYDYNEPNLPKTIWHTPMVYQLSGGAIWDDGKWGEMKYGTLTATNRVPVYLSGIGTNMSYKVISNEMYRRQHIIQNIISDFEIIGRSV
jgi:hypothetical protein